MSTLSNFGGKKHFNEKQAQSWRIFGDENEEQQQQENIRVQTPIENKEDITDSIDDGAVGKARSMKPTPRGFNILYHDDGPNAPSQPQSQPSSRPPSQPSFQPSSRPPSQPPFQPSSQPQPTPVDPKSLSMRPTPRSYNILYHDGGPQHPSNQPNRSAVTTTMETNQPLTGKALSKKPPPRDYNILFHVQTDQINDSNLPADRMSPTTQDVSMEDHPGYNDSVEQDDSQHQMADHQPIYDPEVQEPFSNDSISKSEFRDPSSINDELTSRHSPRKTGKHCAYNHGPASTGIVPVSSVSNRRNSAEGQKLMEKISYEHNMDSRQDPMHSERGKRQGCFVWEDASNAQNIDPSRQSSSRGR